MGAVAVAHRGAESRLRNSSARLSRGKGSDRRGRAGSRGEGGGRCGSGSRGWRSIGARRGGGSGWGLSGSARRRRSRCAGARTGAGAGASARGRDGASRNRDSLTCAGATATKLEDNNVGFGTLGCRDHATSRTTGAGEDVGTVHLVDTHGGWIDTARETVTFPAFTLDFDTEFRLDITEGSGRLQVDRIPANLDVGVTSTIGVGTSSVGRPITNGVGASTPDTCLLDGDTWRVDIVLGGSRTPVGGTGNGQSLQLLDKSRDQHSLITRQHSLAERNGLSSLVLCLHGSSS